MHGKCQEARVEEPSFDIASVLQSLIRTGQCACLVSGLWTEIPVCFCAVPSQLSLRTGGATKNGGVNNLPPPPARPVSSSGCAWAGAEERAAADTQRFGAEPARVTSERLWFHEVWANLGCSFQKSLVLWSLTHRSRRWRPRDSFCMRIIHLNRVRSSIRCVILDLPARRGRQLRGWCGHRPLRGDTAALQTCSPSYGSGPWLPAINERI